jgi:hypothetical protein
MEKEHSLEIIKINEFGEKRVSKTLKWKTSN